MLARNEEYMRRHEEVPETTLWRKAMMLFVQGSFTLGTIFFVPHISSKSDLHSLLCFGGSLVIFVLTCTMLYDLFSRNGPFLREKHYVGFLLVSALALLVMIYRQ